MAMSFSTPVAILLGGLIAGTLDIGAAALINGRNPLVILLVIASGLLGKASFQGGLPAVLLGLVLQWLMSLVISAIFVLLSNRVPELKQHWSAAGLAYGVGIFVVMNYLVVPLAEPVRATAGDGLRVRFAYQPGDEIPALTDGLSVERIHL